ncbi:MAG: hypothetical protein DWQ01_11035 [Planctomycetota bacterium]|nr:MAG: hypothetical protein DWQ01_11035 [Planctomycetota bacterium]
MLQDGAWRFPRELFVTLPQLFSLFEMTSTYDPAGFCGKTPRALALSFLPRLSLATPRWKEIKTTF